MQVSAEPRLAGVYRYPVKGLSPERLASVTLEAGGMLPFDRAWAIENGGGRFDPAQPKPLAKINFLMLMRDERLAALETRVDTASGVMTILRGGKQVACGDLSTRLGRQMIEQFLGAYMKTALRGAPRIVSAPGHHFADTASKCLHIVNLASVSDLERRAGRPIDPLRFRANLLVEGLEPWAERQWTGREIGIGGGVRLAVIEPTGRCEATDVAPGTGARDMAIPQLLQRSFGHNEFGVYARVAVGGTVAEGDAVRV